MSKHKKRKETELEVKEKKDKSLFVYQGERLPISLELREFPWTEKQKNVINTALDKNTNYLFIKAMAGVGKTLLSVYVGLRLLNEGKIKNIIFIRNPVESSSHGLGYLAGDFDTKMDPYIQPMMDHLNELLPPAQVKYLIANGFITSIPLGFLKGRTFNCSLIIGDESEDFTVTDFRLIMGRLGKYAKMLLIGDEEQVNIKNSGFLKIFDLFNSDECKDNGIYCFAFQKEDVMRNKILGYVIDRFKFLN